MSETPNQPPVDLDKLGQHVGQALTKHRERHEEGSQRREQQRQIEQERQEQDRVKAEREQRVSEFKDRLKPFAEKFGGYNKTPDSEVQTLETGTKVTAFVSAQIHTDASSQTFSQVVPSLTETKKQINGTQSGADRYIEKGPFSAMEEYTQNSFPLLNGKGLTVTKEGGLRLQLGLESPNEEGIEPTQDSLLVGVLVDPESIFVVEEMQEVRDNPNHPPFPMGTIIGPDDARFGAMMDTIDHVGQGQGQAPGNQEPFEP